MRHFGSVQLLIASLLVLGLHRLMPARSQHAAVLVNGTFETGNLDGWQVDGNATVVQNLMDLFTNNSLHTVAEGQFAARIGDEMPWQNQPPQSSSLSQEVIVPAAGNGQKTVLQFAYAVVADDPPSHPEADKPLFRARVTNVTKQQTL